MPTFISINFRSIHSFLFFQKKKLKTMIFLFVKLFLLLIMGGKFQPVTPRSSPFIILS